MKNNVRERGFSMYVIYSTMEHAYRGTVVKDGTRRPQFTPTWDDAKKYTSKKRAEATAEKLRKVHNCTFFVATFEEYARFVATLQNPADRRFYCCMDKRN